ncbi:MAG: hypothetical protein ACRC57_09355 [Sarcina sp.]
MIKCIIKKRGYLLLDLVIGLSIISILSIPIYSAITTSIRLKKLSNGQSENSINLASLKKIFENDIPFEFLYNNIKTINNGNVKELIPVDLNFDDFINFSNIYYECIEKDEILNFNIYNSDFVEKFNIRRVSWIDIK